MTNTIQNGMQARNIGCQPF